MQQKTYDLLALSLIPGLGNSRLSRLIGELQDPGELLRAPRVQLRALRLSTDEQYYLVNGWARKDADQALEKAAREGIEILSPFDSEYPALLRQIYDPPLILYCRGAVQALSRAGIAIVGSRRCSVYGREVAFTFARDLAGIGLGIFSGMALGIDSQAHVGALEGGGGTVAVLGTGVDVVYPRSHKKLYRRIVEAGCVVSEFPLGTFAAPQNFPIRNRIISGMALGTLVPEASEFSGSLITARLTLEQNRELWAVPGNITSPGSYGPNHLIKQGATPAVTPQDVLEGLPVSVLTSLLPKGSESTGQKQTAEALLPPLDQREERVMRWSEDGRRYPIRPYPGRHRIPRYRFELNTREPGTKRPDTLLSWTSICSGHGAFGKNKKIGLIRNRTPPTCILCYRLAPWVRYLL